MLKTARFVALYGAAAALFLGAAVMTVPKSDPVVTSSVTLEKTNRANIGSPESFESDRFAG
ncbi:hypothetical protein [Rhizobium sp. CC-YZS058]|uniref:hypothetical protein n=1 Tax=Rhizobium sp. CC-YZS058 TaxID=3042153 RepID=UPI002B052195|nr:hypothetical protein [Rhizobium sp. CC-YZS058]MEA3533756.1 hypothetical protein [Rhizobium sp. CC-YZS058]